MTRRALAALCLAMPLAAATAGVRIAAYLNTSPVARASFWGVRIVDLADNRVIFERNANRLFLPASNAKLFTTALALTRLGPDYRFETRVLADRAPDAAGCVDSLRLIGGGDPSLTIEDLAAQVAAHGVRCVHAGVIGDDTAYVWEPYPSGWSVDDPVWDYGSAVSALCFHDNTITLTLPPDPTRIAIDPPVDYYEIENHVRAGGTENNVHVDRLPGSRHVTLWGQVAPNGTGDVEVVGVDDPALFAARAFRDALVRHGVAVEGGTSAAHLYPHAAHADPANDGVEVAKRESAPLLEDLRLTDKISQNLHAEMALLAVARARRQIGSREAGLAEMADFLDEAGIARDAYNFVDGSGLSRLDLVSPAAIIKLLTYMYRSPQRDAWLSLLPIAGQDGTLHARLTGAATAGRIFAKTGSMSHVAALSGYAKRRNGHMLAFSILVNNANVPPEDLRAAIDRLCRLMIE